MYSRFEETTTASWYNKKLWPTLSEHFKIGVLNRNKSHKTCEKTAIWLGARLGDMEMLPLTIALRDFMNAR